MFLWRYLANMLLIGFCASSVVAVNASGLDLSGYEAICSDLGFTFKTQRHGECVLELYSRSKSATPTQSTSSHPGSALSRGDGSPDDATCVKYGFQRVGAEYAQCRMQIDLARNQALEQQRQYEAQLIERQREQEKARGAALLLHGLNTMSGGRRSPPSTMLPLAPPNSTRIYNLPGGKFMTCSTMGTVTNCM
jgi:hypothetical protein